MELEIRWMIRRDIMQEQVGKRGELVVWIWIYTIHVLQLDTRKISHLLNDFVSNIPITQKRAHASVKAEIFCPNFFSYFFDR